VTRLAAGSEDQSDSAGTVEALFPPAVVRTVAFTRRRSSGPGPAPFALTGAFVAKRSPVVCVGGALLRRHSACGFQIAQKGESARSTVPSRVT
jgi:hypothetical protein